MPALVKPYRTLTLTSPYMSGSDVTQLQMKWKDLKADGVFGEATAAKVRDWRYRVGFPSAIPALGVDGQNILLGLAPLPQSYRLRAKARGAADPAPLLPPGAKAVNLMVQWAQAQYTEDPPNSNKVPELQHLAKEQGLAPFYQNMGWPWCAFAANLSGLISGTVAGKEGLVKGHFNALYVPAIYDAARKGLYGLSIVGKPAAKRGDLVIFNWDGGVPDHIGRLLSRGGADSINTVEGNTSPGVHGSQSDGGGVFIRNRPMSTVTAFIRES